MSRRQPADLVTYSVTSSKTHNRFRPHNCVTNPEPDSALRCRQPKLCRSSRRRRAWAAGPAQRRRAPAPLRPAGERGRAHPSLHPDPCRPAARGGSARRPRGRRRPVSLAERGALGFGDGNGNKDAGFRPAPGLIRSGRRVGYSGQVGCRRRVWHSAACWATSLSRLAPAYGGLA